MSYIVMECHSSYAILLDENGCFFKAANLHYEVGQKVYDPVLVKEESPRKFRPARWIPGSAAAIAACFLLVFGAGYYRNHMVSYSAIYLTINPEIQMDLNRRGEVLDLEGINEDGKLLLEGYEGRGKDKTMVADELIDRAIDMGFLSEGGQISFSIDSPDEALFRQYGEELKEEVNRHLKDRFSITIEIIDPHTGESETTSVEKPVQEETGQTEQAQPEPETEASPPAASSPEPAAPQTSGDSDYGPGSDGDTQYSQPEPQPVQPAAPVYSEEGESDYDEYEGESDYEDEEEDDEEDEEEDEEE